MIAKLLHAVPMASFHRRVRHHLEERDGLVEVVDLVVQNVERLPLFQALRKSLASARKAKARFGWKFELKNNVGPTLNNT